MNVQNCYHCFFGFDGKGPILGQRVGNIEGKKIEGNCSWGSYINFPLGKSTEPILIENSVEFNACAAYQEGPFEGRIGDQKETLRIMVAKRRWRD